MKRNLLKNDGVQSLLASLVCVVLGLFLGYVVLLAINPAGAGEAILTVIKNFLTYNRPSSQLKYLGNTLVKTAPLLMCALSILFAYKVGLFNIGAAGQYCIGAALCLYAALGLSWGWLPCLIAAMLGGAVLGAISGVLKSYCNVNEVISGIMLNWIVAVPYQYAADHCEGGYQPLYAGAVHHQSLRAAALSWHWAAV